MRNYLRCITSHRLLGILCALYSLPTLTGQAQNADETSQLPMRPAVAFEQRHEELQSPDARDSELSVIVAENPRTHLEQTLKSFFRIKQQQNVQLGKVFIVSANAEKPSSWRLMLDPHVKAGLQETPIDRFGVYQVPILQVRQVPEHMGITQSPTWVVRRGSKYHVFEGSYAPDELFDQTGSFIAESLPIGLGTTPPGLRGSNVVRYLKQPSNVLLNQALSESNIDRSDGGHSQESSSVMIGARTAGKVTHGRHYRAYLAARENEKQQSQHNNSSSSNHSSGHKLFEPTTQQDAEKMWTDLTTPDRTH